MALLVMVLAYRSASAQPSTGVTGWGGNGVGGAPIPSGLSNIIAISLKGGLVVLQADGTVPGLTQTSNVVAIASGYSHNLLVTNGLVFGWGDNTAGEINPPSGLSNVVAVAAGVQDSLALRSDGTVIGWGYNGYGQVSVPAGLTGVTAISAGYYHTLALKNDGSVVAWGYNGEGETNVPAGLTGVVAIAGGYYHSLALKSDGTVVGWGSNSSGQQQTPPGLSNVVAIAAGGLFSLALKNDGTVVAWGDNFYGQTNVPPGLSNVVAVGGAYNYTIALTNNGAPWIVKQPVDRIVYPGSDVSFTAVVLGAPPLNFQWQSNGVALSGATNLILNLTNIQPNAAGSYQLVISNAAGVAISSNAVLGVIPPPLIDVEPQNLITNGGSNVTFTANISNQGPFKYQWLFNGTNLAGATNSTLVLTNALDSQSGVYALSLTNSFGSATSSNASLTVVPWVTASIQPNTLVAGSGTYALFTIRSGGFATNTTYQWRLNGNSMGDFWLWTSTAPGAYVNSSMSAAGTYDVVATDPYTSVTSSVATLTVIPLVITGQPTNRGVWLGGSARFAATVVGQAPLSYQWQFFGTNLPGATTNTLYLTNVQSQQLGPYALVITNAYTNITSSVVTLSISEVAVWGGVYGETNLIAGLTNVIAIAAGTSGNIDCEALQSNGTAVNWPLNYGPYGNFSTNLIAITGAGSGYGLRPNGVVVRVPNDGAGNPSLLSNVVAFSTFNSTLLALRTDNTISVLAAPTGPPAGLTNMVAVAAGGGHYLGLRADGTMMGWGNNTYGQATIPSGLTNVIAIAAGLNHSLALRDDSTVVAWGYNGNGQTNVPAGLSNVVSIASGWNHCLALHANGTVVAWGYNGNGQTNVPLALTNVIAIAAGQYHSMALIGQGPPVTHAAMLNPHAGPNGFSVSLPSQSARIFVLEYKSSLSDSNWTLLPPVPGNGTTALLVDPSGTNTQRSYRVQRW